MQSCQFCINPMYSLWKIFISKNFTYSGSQSITYNLSRLTLYNYMTIQPKRCVSVWGLLPTLLPRLVSPYSRLYQEQTRLFPPLLLLLHLPKLPGSVPFTLGPKDRASRSHPQHALAPSPTLPYCRRPRPGALPPPQHLHAAAADGAQKSFKLRQGKTIRRHMAAQLNH